MKKSRPLKNPPLFGGGRVLAKALLIELANALLELAKHSNGGETSKRVMQFEFEDFESKYLCPLPFQQ
eukprot:TRINITY_DN3879_c0_g1_i1.p3 TRINITY_DN3879_c0_g1~~TRINITY_DN3879_c0_g1_i1.p3  ORF type:complete len:68 (-),score=13.64 TRINITY_DN3879_c0_g1_i1:128-331(-)